MDFVSSIGGSLVGNRSQAGPISSANAYVESGAASDAGIGTSNGKTQFGSKAANDVSTCLLDIFKQTLAEADSYLVLFEARVKLEDEYVRGLKAISDKARDTISKLDNKMSASMSLDPSKAELPKARLVWRELLQNHLIEMDARMHYAETLRQGVVAPLTMYRDAQERIRKRVKDDLKTSIAAYDDMRFHTLPRAKKAYDKKCDEVEQIRLQQQAIEDQKTLLSQSNLQRNPSNTGSSNEPFSPTSSEAEEDRMRSEPETAATSPKRSLSLRRKRHSDKIRSEESNGSHSHPHSGSESHSPPLGGEGSLATSPTSAGERRGHFLDALRSRENWEAARKEAPKKFNAFLNRMRDGTGSEKGELNTFAGSAEYTNSTSPPGGASLGGGPGSMRSNQNIALKNVKAKREAEEADKIYRKVVFDLETLRLRREKTVSAARTSVLDARQELYHTCQAIWIQAERSLQILADAQISNSAQAEKVIEGSLDNLGNEIETLQTRLPAVLEERVPYVNYYIGECKDLIFGVSLVDYAFSRSQHTAPHLGPAKNDAPLIVKKCIQFVEERALDQPGIYRISAKHTAIQNLAHALERDEERFQFSATNDEPSTVAGVLKLYLRQLPEPVLAMPWEERVKYTHERHEQIQTGFAALKSRIRRLPPINQATLRTIIEHLANVAAHAEQNKMSASNLSIIFGPLLLSQADHETTSIAAAMEEDKVTEDLILYAQTIFDLSRAGAPVLPPLPPSAAGTEASWNELRSKQPQISSEDGVVQPSQNAFGDVEHSEKGFVTEGHPSATHSQDISEGTIEQSSSKAPATNASTSKPEDNDYLSINADSATSSTPKVEESSVPQTASAAYEPPIHVRSSTNKVYNEDEEDPTTDSDADSQVNGPSEHRETEEWNTSPPAAKEI